MTKCRVIKGAIAASLVFACTGLTFAQDSTTTAVGPNFNASALQANGTYDRFIVRYRDGTAQQSSAAAAMQALSTAMAHAASIRATLSSNTPTVSYQRKLATGSNLMRVSRKLTPEEAASFVQAVAADPDVAYVAPDVLRQHTAIKAATAFTANDPNFIKYQTDYLPADGALTTAGNSIANWGGANITGAWNLGADGTGVTIAVLDTGIVKHADVNTSLGDAGYDFISDSFVSGRSTDDRASGGWDTGDWTTNSRGAYYCGAGSSAESSSWHGTHVASAAGAELTNNGLGMAGMAYNAHVLPVRVLGHCGGYDSDIDDAIVWAAGGHVDGVPDNTHPAQVINLSLGGQGTCPASDDAALAIAQANALGAVVVIAAGNDGADVKNDSPASCPGAVAVASIGITSRLSFYSNYNSPGENIIAVGAFGGGVYTNDGSSGTQLNPEGFAWQALNTGTTTPVASPGGDTYGGFAGTSQATPHVTAAVALMQSARLVAGLPLLKPTDVTSILKSTAAAPHVAPNASKTFGAGILDAGAAVAAAVSNGGGGGGGSDPAVITLSNGVITGGQSGASGSTTVYKLTVPANALALTLRTTGGTGSDALYVKVGSIGNAANHDYQSTNAGTSQLVSIARPMAGDYYLSVVSGPSGYSNVTVLGSFSAQ